MCGKETITIPSSPMGTKYFGIEHILPTILVTGIQMMKIDDPMRLLLATTNAGKVTEMREALEGLPCMFLSLADIDPIDPPFESGETFEENAAEKAMYYFEASGLPSLADDSGIIIDALKDELGVHTRRWGAGPDASDAEWIEFFLERMHHEPNKRARFTCVLSLVDAAGKTHLFRGDCEGVITDTLEADYLPGLPLSACFRPDGQERVFSALTVEQKNSSSHRGRALNKLRNFFTL